MKSKRRKKAIFLYLGLLVLTFSTATYAWFIFSTRVTNRVQAHVRAWNVAFEIGNDPTENYILVEVDDAYPGMETYNKRVRASNHGETDADLTYEIVSARIFGTTYTAGEGGMTSERLESKLNSEYPFSFNVTLSSNVIRVGDTSQYYTFAMSWPYESGDDVQDTYWGNMAYDYHESNPTEPSIFLEIKIKAIQRAATTE